MPFSYLRILISCACVLVLHTASSQAECTNNTVWELFTSDPDFSVAANIARRLEVLVQVSIFIRADLNSTLFLPINSAIGEDFYQFIQIDNVTSAIDWGAAITIPVYAGLQGIYSPQNLTAVPSINTLLGQWFDSDFPIIVTKNEETEQLNILDSGGNTARVLEVVPACNGFLYKIDKLLVPKEKVTELPQKFGFGDDLLKIFDTGSNCTETVSDVLDSSLPETSQWQQVLRDTCMADPVSDYLMSSTIFIPENSEDLTRSLQTLTSADTVMYNMIQGFFCPAELVAAGSFNTMLGDVAGLDLPLTFTNDSGTIKITGQLGSARVLKTIIGCHTQIVVTDALLVPPPLPPPFIPSKCLDSAKKLPTLPIRHMTCALPGSAPFNASALVNTTTANGSANDNAAAATEKSHTVVIAGALIGGVAVVTVAVFAVLVVGGKRRKRQRRESAQMLPTTKSNTLEEVTPPTAAAAAAAAAATSTPTASKSGSRTQKQELASVVFSSDETASEFLKSLGLSTNIVRSTSSTTASGTSAAAVAGGGASGAGSSGTKTINPKMFTRLGYGDAKKVDLWTIDPVDVQIVLAADGRPVELGKGSFGTVYRGTLRNVQPAAVKVLKSSIGSEAEAAFQQEAAILKHVNRDRNIVRLYGTSQLNDGQLLLITELMDGGDLRRALDSPETAEKLAWHRHGKGIAQDIARGLTSLHANKVVHRDLKSRNVLLDAYFGVKIADVGFAAVQSQGYLTATAGRVAGTLAWCAPELLLGAQCSDKVDVFSFGVVLWELATGSVPKRGFIEPPPVSQRCPRELSELIKDCIKTKPQERPTAREIYTRISEFPVVVDVES